ncbi:MAG: hypothetical protein HRU19_10375 [Pseudobacteriovorax sp.]|nr:hypothetical protein [Pseudobacteriovorax sp.]
MPEGGEFDLAGPMASEMGCKSLGMTVSQIKSKDLLHRFSSGMMCDWMASSDDSGKVSAVIEELRRKETSSKPRIFLAIQSPALRNAIIRHLGTKSFYVRTSMDTEQSIINEPKYFSPHLVFIEHRLCEAEQRPVLESMVQNLPKEAEIVIVGSQKKSSSRIANFVGGRVTHDLPQIPKNLADLVAKSYLPPHTNDTGANIYISPAHRFSHGNVSIEANLDEYGPTTIRLTLRREVAKYSLIKISQQTLGTLYAKVISGRAKSAEGFEITCKVSLTGLDWSSKSSGKSR